MNAAAALLLSRALRHHCSTLKTLQLNYCHGTSADWSAHFQPLWLRKSALKRLILEDDCVMSDEVVNALSDSLEMNSRLTELSLIDITANRVTATGLVTLTSVLRTPSSVLTKLHLGGTMND
jgi:hypothetical protein